MSQSKLRFSIEESVWLKKGQEVAEVLSMSLNPEINISEESGQVYIKGALILNGKYHAEKQDDDEGQNLEGNPLSEGVSYRSLTQLNVAEDGVTELVHRFPVDITIPSYRVDDSNQVKVEVESFEYELPNSTCFELSASICIYGIKDEKQRQESQAFELPKETVRSAVEERSDQDEVKSEIFTPFQFEARQSGGVPSQSQQDDFQAIFREEAPAPEVRSEKKTAYEFKPHFEEIDDKTMEATFDSLKSIAFSNADMRHSDDEQTEEPETEEQYLSEYEDDQEESNYNESHSEEQEYASYEHPYNEQHPHAHDAYNYQQNSYQNQQNSYQNQQNPYHNQQSYQQPERPYEYNPYQQPSYSPQENNYQAHQDQNYGDRPYDTGEYGEQTFHGEQEYEHHGDNYTEEDLDQSYEYEGEAEANSYEEQEAPQEEREDEPKDENALYLTKMLSGKEDRFSKMRMYILQRGDSLEHICERYDISLNTLMRMNQLQQGEVSEGQIIYIPVSAR